MTTTAQHRAVIEALGISATDLRALAETIERQRPTTLVQHVAQDAIDALPPGHLYSVSLRRLIRWAGEQDARSVKASDIVRWAQQAGDEARRMPNARHGIGAEEAFVLAARCAYTRGLESGAVDENPAAAAELPARPDSRRTALESGQLQEIHLSLTTYSRDPELDDLIFQFLRETAARRGGAIRLSARDLAPATKTVRLTEKYDKQRWQPVSAHLLDRLVAHQHERHPGCSRVFHRRDGSHLNHKWFEGFARRCQRPAWAAELGVSAHWLRHTTLTDIERIAGLRVAGAYAGHSDGTRGATGIYTKASPTEIRWAHSCLFFVDDVDANNPTVPPQLFRRVQPARIRPVDFVVA